MLLFSSYDLLLYRSVFVLTVVRHFQPQWAAAFRQKALMNLPSTWAVDRPSWWTHGRTSKLEAECDEWILDGVDLVERDHDSGLISSIFKCTHTHTPRFEMFSSIFFLNTTKMVVVFYRLYFMNDRKHKHTCTQKLEPKDSRGGGGQMPVTDVTAGWSWQAEVGDGCCRLEAVRSSWAALLKFVHTPTHVWNYSYVRVCVWHMTEQYDRAAPSAGGGTVCDNTSLPLLRPGYGTSSCLSLSLSLLGALVTVLRQQKGCLWLPPPPSTCLDYSDLFLYWLLPVKLSCMQRWASRTDLCRSQPTSGKNQQMHFDLDDLHLPI